MRNLNSTMWYWPELKGRIIFCLMLAAVCVHAQYCLPTYQVSACNSGDYINGVQFNTINNQNTGCPSSSPNYFDFTGTYCTSVCAGGTYLITISNNANNGEYMAVAIDLQGDGSFADPGDFFGIGYAAPGAVISANITIPLNSATGSTRLRVFCQGSTTPLMQTDVCGNLQTGDVQDYCLTINPAVNLTLPGSVTQCGGNVTLNAYNPGDTFLWSDGSTAQTLVASTSGAYSVTATNSLGCSSSATVQVYIKPVPVAYLGGAVTSCGAPVTLDAGNPGQLYAWSGGQTTQTIQADSTAAYSVTVTDAGSGCSASSSVQVNIDTVPVVTLGTFTAQCAGVDTLDAGNAGATYLWSDGSTNQMLIAGTSGIYRVTVTNANQCTATATDNITIYHLPAVTLSMQPYVCNTVADFTLYGGVPAGGIYFVDGIADTSINTINEGIARHNITYVYTDTFGCTDSALAVLVVRQHPFITTLDFPAICTSSKTIDLDNYFTPGGGVYSGLGVSTHYFYPPAVMPGNDTIIDIVTDSYGCIDTSIFPFAVKAAVKVNMTPDVLDNSICAGQTVTFNANGAEQYQFFINGIAQDSMSAVNTYTTFGLQNGDAVTVVGANQCSTDTSGPVAYEVHALPAVSAGNDTSVALGQAVQLNAVATGTSLLVYQWWPASVLNISNIPDPVYSGQADSVVFTVAVSDIYGCVDSAHVTVHVFVPDAIVLPNVITPDGNGKNDTWKINTRVDLSGSRLIVFNRWGQTVYFKESYNNDWGGTYMDSGTKLPDGTYYYELTVPSQDNHLYKGAINILNSGAKE